MKTTLTILAGLSIILFQTAPARSQGIHISANPGEPDESSILELESASQGFLLPRMSTSERNNIANPAQGLVIFNTNTNCFNVRIGNTWKQLCPQCEELPPSPTAGANGPLCEGETLLLTASTVSGATYQWYGPGGFSSGDQNPSVPSVTSGASGTYTVTATVGDCTSPASSVVVAVQSSSLDTPSPISGPATVCVNSEGNVYSVDAVEGADSYVWNVPSGASIFFGQGTNSVTVNFGATSGNVTATAQNECATSAVGTLAVSVTGITATGGTITETDDYVIHTFTSSGTFTVNPLCGGGAVDVLVVAGGGGGGGGSSAQYSGGGGGAGGVIQTSLTLDPGDYTVIVGNGGAGTTGTNNQASDGGNSVFHSLTAIGGGGGGSFDNQPGRPGGSGGGSGGGGNPTGPGNGTSGQGFAGGQGGEPFITQYRGGGGGGAGGPGGSIPAGTGGQGIVSSISGTPITYSQGGSGGGNVSTPGPANTGNGGSASQNGGSGIVIVRYAKP